MQFLQGMQEIVVMLYKKAQKILKFIHLSDAKLLFSNYQTGWIGFNKLDQVLINFFNVIKLKIIKGPVAQLVRAVHS